MAEYSYIREMISGRYNIGSSMEKSKIHNEIKIALPEKTLSSVNMHGSEVKVTILPDLDVGEKITLDTVIQDHKDNSSTNLISRYKVTGDYIVPSELDITLFGFFRKDIFDNLGSLIEKYYYKNYDGTIYSDLVVKDEYVYTYVPPYNLVFYRDETITWYLEDDSIGYVKTFRKYYDSRCSIIEANKRRSNLIDTSQAYGMANITGLHASGIGNGQHFFLDISTELDNYRVGVKMQELIDKIQVSTETYLTQQMKDDFEAIFDYWT